jgi:NADH-quinone oxidoreductase subunit K
MNLINALNLNNYFFGTNIDISLLDLLSWNLTIFLLSFVGIFFNNRNFLISLICIELLFLSVSFNFVIFAYFLNNPLGYLYCLISISISAAETAIGLSLLILIYRTSGKVTFDSLITLRG